MFSNPAAATGELEHLVNVMDRLEAALAQVRHPGERMAVQIVFSTHQALRSQSVHATLVAALSNYQLTAAERKLLEKGSREFSKKRLVIRDGHGEATLQKLAEDLHRYRALLSKLSLRGKLLEAETAHAFVVVNAGGFSAAIMTSVSGQVKRAGELLTDHGFGEICYGEVVITNTIHRSGRVLAFYFEHEDRLYIRANRRKTKNEDMIHAVVHELGHRLYKRFLTSKQHREIESLYHRLRDMPYSDVKGPFPGQIVAEGKKRYEVAQFTPYAVELRNTETGRPAAVPMSAWPRLVGRSPFVTPYASTTAEENFCEMLAFYCMDQEMVLHDDFERILK